MSEDNELLQRYRALEREMAALYDVLKIGYIDYENVKEMFFEESGYPCYFERIFIRFDNDNVSYYKVEGIKAESLSCSVETGMPTDAVGLNMIPDGKDLIIEKLKKVGIEEWIPEYYNNDICDGIQWSFVIKYNNGKEIEISGSNEYPKTYEKLKWLFEQFFKLKRTKILIEFKKCNPYVYNIVAERKKYNGYKVYSPIYKEDVPTGLPAFVLEKNGELKYRSGEDGLKILDFLNGKDNL